MHRHRLVAVTAAIVCTLTALAVPTAAQAASTADVRTASSSALYGNGPYRVPTSVAARAATELAAKDPAGAAAATTIARYPVATWLGEWSVGTALPKTVDAATAGAAASGTTAVFVTYAIPDRDCGGYSSGGFDETTYDAWIDRIVGLLAGKRAAVVVEPDSLAMIGNGRCSAATEQQRYRILSREVAALTAARIPAYLDAGHSNWQKPAVMAARLRSAGIASARGFATNVAGYRATADEQAYAQQVSALTGGSHYVIDTSRNGRGDRGTWCNGPGAGLGTSPRVVSDGTALDALLWVKTPGASDGTCGGAPEAGAWYSAFAQALVANAVLGPPVAAPSGTPTVGPSAGPAVHDPSVRLDPATPVAAGLAVRGYAVDADAPRTALTVTIRVDGVVARTVTADVARPDVQTTTAAGTAHGFAAVVPAGAGRHTVCARATDVGGGRDVTGRCAVVDVAASAPTGSFDTAVSPRHRRVTVQGWAFDRDDVGSPVAVRVTVAGKAVGRFVADGVRADVDRATGAGAAHGWTATVVGITGSRQVCVTAEGIGGGGDRSLGCRTVSVG